MLENDDIRTVLIATDEAVSPDQPPIRLCDEHYQQQETTLEFYGQLNAPKALQTFHVIASLAARTLGTKSLVRHGCPVCALQKFDYLGELIPIVLGVKVT